jgi:hypothetical protein
MLHDSPTYIDNAKQRRAQRKRQRHANNLMSVAREEAIYSQQHELDDIQKSEYNYDNLNNLDSLYCSYQKAEMINHSAINDSCEMIA